jgi:hypothetical protein
MVAEADFNQEGRISFEAFKVFMRVEPTEPERKGSMILRSPSLRRRPSMSTPQMSRRKSVVTNVAGKLPVQLKDMSKQIGAPSPHFSRLQDKKKVKFGGMSPTSPEPRLWDVAE